MSELSPDIAASSVPGEWLARLLRAEVYPVARRSALQPAPKLSARVGAQVLLKREDTQPVYSFKLRGAYNHIAQRVRGGLSGTVLAVSAGNHAQGVALAASRLGLSALIVMPRTTPQIKVDAVRALGAQIELHGDSYDAAAAHGRALAEARGVPLVHPYDDADVIAGQGTIGLELLEQCADLHTVFVPVGGGGLAAGVALALKASRPSIRVIAVEPDDAACLRAALAAGAPVDLSEVGLFVDGCAVRRVGALPYALLRERLDGLVTVSTDEVCAAIREIFEDTRTVVEPAGALAVAGMRRFALESFEGAQARAAQSWVAIVSGANLNFDRLAHVVERAQVGEHHEALYGVTIAERPGSFLSFCEALGRRPVTEFNYRHQHADRAEVYVGVELKSGYAERLQIAQELTAAGYTVNDLTDNELARTHLRHLCGGVGPGGRERMFRVVFPERPGALLDFLRALGGRWDITLFHYRNHGAAFGRVLVGFAVAPDADARFEQDLAATGLAVSEESANPALHQFLAIGTPAAQANFRTASDASLPG